MEEKGKSTKSLGRGLFIESRAIEDGNGARPFCPCCTDVSSLFPLSFPPQGSDKLARNKHGHIFVFLFSRIDPPNVFHECINICICF